MQTRIEAHEIKLPATPEEKRAMHPKQFAAWVTVGCSFVLGAIAWLGGLAAFAVVYAHRVTSPSAGADGRTRVLLYGMLVGAALATLVVAVVAPRLYRFLTYDPNAVE